MKNPDFIGAVAGRLRFYDIDTLAREQLEALICYAGDNLKAVDQH